MCIMLNVQHHYSISRLVLYQVRDLCCIKLGTCVVSIQKLVLYQVKYLCGIKLGHYVVSSPIYVLMCWGRIPLLWYYVGSILESCVVSILESCVVSILLTFVVWSLDLCCVESMILIDGTTWEWFPIMNMDLCCIKSCGYTMWYIDSHGH